MINIDNKTISTYFSLLQAESPLPFSIDLKTQQIFKNFCDKEAAYIGAVTAGGLFIYDLIFLSLEESFIALNFVSADSGIKKEICDLIKNRGFLGALQDITFTSLTEQLLFTVVMQESVKSLAIKKLPDQEIDLLGYTKVPLSTFIAIVASSILSGSLHINGGCIQVVRTVANNFILGLLQEKIGFTASCTAHMITNTLLVPICLFR